jgi:hypothetical protein
MLGNNLSNGDYSGDLLGIPYVNDYRYLGTWVNGSLAVEPHLEKAKRKSDYQTRKLTPMRLELDLRFNARMFQTTIMPNMRMIGVIYTEANKGDKEKVEKQFRKCFRSFCCLPWTSPNELIAKLIGDVAVVLVGMAKVVEHKSNCRRLGIRKNYDLILWWKSQTTYAKFVPKKITELFREMYGRKCRVHSKTMNRTHLRE